MEHTRYQWMLFLDDKHQEQVVVRCGQWEEFLASVSLVRKLFLHEGNGNITQIRANIEPAIEPELPTDQCPIHGKTMKLRTGKGGNTWYDHRFTVDDVWHICTGKEERIQKS